MSQTNSLTTEEVETSTNDHLAEDLSENRGQDSRQDDLEELDEEEEEVGGGDAADLQDKVRNSPSYQQHGLGRIFRLLFVCFSRCVAEFG
jgi:hypothetical protein